MSAHNSSPPQHSVASQSGRPKIGSRPSQRRLTTLQPPWQFRSPGCSRTTRRPRWLRISVNDDRSRCTWWAFDQHFTQQRPLLSDGHAAIVALSHPPGSDRRAACRSLSLCARSRTEGGVAPEACPSSEASVRTTPARRPHPHANARVPRSWNRSIRACEAAGLGGRERGAARHGGVVGRHLRCAGRASLDIAPVPRAGREAQRVRVVLAEAAGLPPAGRA